MKKESYPKYRIIALIIISFITGFALGSIREQMKSNENIDSYKDIHGKTRFKINETFENKYEKITMIEVSNYTGYSEYLKPKEGNKIIAVKFEVENINDENDELYVSSLNFNAYADGVAQDQYIYASDEYDDLSATIGKGKKAIGYVLYEVPTSASKITIEYNADFWVDGNTIEFIVQ